jgi:hypothetical protein
VNKAKDMGLLRIPLNERSKKRIPLNVGYTTDFPIIQYADDTLLIMEACPQKLFVLKALLNTFADSTGLKVNYSKSSMVPINFNPKRLNHLATRFKCVTGSLSFTYLGLSLSNSKLTIQECLPLLHRVERRLLSKAMFLTQGGKLLMVNSILSSLPTFYMCSIKVPVDILNQIDKYRRHCLWHGGDVNDKKPPRAAWKLVCWLKKEVLV